MIDLDALRRHVAILSDEALLETDREALVEAAQQIYDAEVASRGLAWPEAEGEGEGEEGEGVDAADLVSVANYESLEEARFARTLLRNEGIPVWFAGELTPSLLSDPRAALEMLTREEFFEQAQLVLSTEISDEELARQAEEAESE